jgi:hypothetical protein
MVDWHFEEGAFITSVCGPIFNDRTLNKSFNISGYGSFISIDGSSIFSIGNVLNQDYSLEGRSATVSFDQKTDDVAVLTIGTGGGNYFINFETFEIEYNSTVPLRVNLTNNYACVTIKSPNVVLNVDHIYVSLGSIINTSANIYAINIACAFTPNSSIGINSEIISMYAGTYQSNGTNVLSLICANIPNNSSPGSIQVNSNTLSLSANNTSCNGNLSSIKIIDVQSQAQIDGMNLDVRTNTINLQITGSTPINSITNVLNSSRFTVSFDATTINYSSDDNNGSIVLFSFDASSVKLNLNLLSGTVRTNNGNIIFVDVENNSSVISSFDEIQGTIRGDNAAGSLMQFLCNNMSSATYLGDHMVLDIVGSNAGTVQMITAGSETGLSAKYNEAILNIQGQNSGYASVVYNYTSNANLDFNTMKINLGAIGSPGNNSGTLYMVENIGETNLTGGDFLINFIGDTDTHTNATNTGNTTIIQSTGTITLNTNNLTINLQDNLFSSVVDSVLLYGFACCVSISQDSFAIINSNIVQILLAGVDETNPNALNTGEIICLLLNDNTSVKSGLIQIQHTGTNQGEMSINNFTNLELFHYTIDSNEVVFNIDGNNQGAAIVTILVNDSVMNVNYFSTTIANNTGFSSVFNFGKNVSALNANSINISGVNIVFAASGDNEFAKIRVNHLTANNMNVGIGELLQVSVGAVDLDIRFLDFSGDNFINVNTSKPDFIKIGKFSGTLLSGFILSTGTNTETHFEIEEFNVQSTGGDNFFTIPCGTHFMNIDVLDFNDSVLNNVINQTEGDFHFNVKKIQGSLSLNSSFINLTTGRLFWNSEMVGFGVASIPSIPFFNLSNSPSFKLNASSFDIGFGSNDISSLFNLSQVSDSSISLDNFGCSFANVTNNIFSVRSSNLIFRSNNITTNVNGAIGYLFDLGYSQGTFFIKNCSPNFFSSSEGIFNLGNGTNFYGDIINANVVNSLLITSTSDIVDLNVGDVTSNYGPNIIINGGSLNNKHTYRGTYRNTGLYPIINVQVPISGSPVISQCVFVTNSTCIDSVIPITINNYITSVSKTGAQGAVNFLIPSTFIVDAGVV